MVTTAFQNAQSIDECSKNWTSVIFLLEAGQGRGAATQNIRAGQAWARAEGEVGPFCRKGLMCKVSPDNVAPFTRPGTQ
jgi:hypothetical protein